MSFFVIARSFLRNLFLSDRVDADLDEEVHSHLKVLARQNLHAGMQEVEAQHRARIEQFKEQVREERLGNWLHSIVSDFRFTLRQLRKSPGFTGVAILTLALGIGGTTAIFTLVQQVMLQSLPVSRPEQLWRVGDATICCYSNGYSQGGGDVRPLNDWTLFSWEAYKVFRTGTAAFDELAAFQVGDANAHLGVRRAGSLAPAEPRNGEYVSGNFFKTFGIAAWRGRLFDDADDAEGAPPVAVISFQSWQGKYGSDPSVVGATYDVNGHPFTIVGVAPPGFFGAKIASADMPDFWLPVATEPLIAGATSRLRNPRLAWLALIGRVRPDTNPKTLEAQLQVELHQWLTSHRADMTAQEDTLLDKQTVHIAPGGAGVSLMRENYQESLWLLMMAALCVLLLACANIANLLLARGLKDQHQTSIRAALGASSGRLIRQAFAESLTLSFLGAIAGVAVAYAGASLILRLVLTQLDAIPIHAAPSLLVLLFALGVSVITGVVFGIAPAWMSAHAQPIEALRGANRSAGGRRHWAQRTLVIMQVAGSIVLLSAAAMLAQSLRNLERQNFGFDTRGRYLISIDPWSSNYRQEQLAPLFHGIEEQLRSIPGVRMAGAVLEAPQSGWVWPHDIRVVGKPEADDTSSGWSRVTPDFFQTLGEAIVIGRSFTSEDTANTRLVAIVNESFAEKFFAKENPLGQQFGLVRENNAATYEIVGVVADVDFADGPEPMYFLPEAQSAHFDDAETAEREVASHYLYDLVVWAPANPPDLGARVKQALTDVDPNLVMKEVQPYSGVIHANFAQQKMIATLTWLFGAIGLVLAALGLYGVTAYGVEQRTREIGVRMALGSRRGSVLLMVLREAFWQVGIGLALGIPAAIGAGYVIANHLFGVTPWDPLMLSTATLLLGLATHVAAVIPARSASRVDPMIALRNE